MIIEHHFHPLELEREKTKVLVMVFRKILIQALHFIENEDEQADNEQENIEPTSAVCESVKKKRIWLKETKSLEWWWELSSVWSRSKSLHNSPITIPFIADVMDTVTKN